VPVIEDQGQTLYDSWTIANYLDEAYPDRPLLFSGEEAKTLTFFLKHWVERSLHGPFFRLIVLDIEKHLHDKDKAYFRSSREKRLGKTLEAFAGDPQQALAALRAALDPLRPVLAESAFLSGRTPGFADYLLIAEFQWARAVSAVKLLEADDPIAAWRERVMNLFGGYARKAVGYPV
jgi:glutathione S-transferase